eukprot:CAMPEP_0170445890 /NCGR_PEP_ID=MMETSP0117_2-20130122/49308_1 /TAXON_ID=400756 /ORGANISM="Durinskia baltica, Strain CSIRO CS-38" /LENGTH=40 /DNA_ID= /DNA_START= /DNA_END= /DNA_ORIENTATION=
MQQAQGLFKACESQARQTAGNWPVLRAPRRGATINLGQVR